MDIDNPLVEDPTARIHAILADLGPNVKEVSFHRLKSLLKDKYGVRVSGKNIQDALCANRRIILTGWGRGDERLYRLPDDLAISVQRLVLC